MSKYIDAEQAVNEIRQPYLRGFTSDDFAFGFKSGIENAVNTIKQMPAADVVEVVRCRECRYREKEQPGMVYCPNTVGGWVDEDWFCAGGEKE